MSKLPVRELVPKRNPVLLYQNLQDKKTKYLTILVNLTSIALTSQVIDIYSISN